MIVLGDLRKCYGPDKETFTNGEILSIVNKMEELQQIYHSNAILSADVEDLLIDTGTVFSLTGDAWSERMETHLPANMPAEYEELAVPQGILGVGETPSKATQEVAMPIGLLNQ